jgi:hypothetical protein
LINEIDKHIKQIFRRSNRWTLILILRWDFVLLIDTMDKGWPIEWPMAI